jgi:type II secretory pathway component PulF
MRVIAGLLVVIGLLTALVGELAMFFQHDKPLATSVATIPDVDQALSLWPVVALGISMAALGFLLNAIRRRTDRRRIRGAPGYEVLRHFRRHRN